MILGMFALLAFIPLLGIAWIVLAGTLFTADGLFMSLILLTISGLFGTTMLFEFKTRHSSGPGSGKASGSSLKPGTTAGSGGSAVRGQVQSVQFYEADVGQPNKSIVMLGDGAKGSQMLVFEGDMRNALPVGQKVQVTFRKQSGLNLLLDVTYS
jgi:hypothetical protein